MPSGMGAPNYVFTKKGKLRIIQMAACSQNCSTCNKYPCMLALRHDTRTPHACGCTTRVTLQPTTPVPATILLQEEFDKDAAILMANTHRIQKETFKNEAIEYVVKNRICFAILEIKSAIERDYDTLSVTLSDDDIQHLWDGFKNSYPLKINTFDMRKCDMTEIQRQTVLEMNRRHFNAAWTASGLIIRWG